MRDIRVAAVQMRCALGEKESNLRSISAWCVKAKEKKAELVCFPEYGVTGIYGIGSEGHLDGVAETVRGLAERVPDGPSVGALARVAKRTGLFISAGLVEVDNHLAYNTYFVVGPKGYVGKYRKTHMPAMEYPFVRSGQDFPTYDLDGCKVGISTCFDNTMPEVPRILALNGAEIILMPHAWSNEDAFYPENSGNYDDRRREVLAFIPSRAYDNKAYVVYVDQAGRVSDSTSFPGVSMLLDPRGQVLAESHGAEEMIVADFAADVLAKERGRPDSSLRARRPEIYGGLSAKD